MIRTKDLEADYPVQPLKHNKIAVEIDGKIVFTIHNVEDAEFKLRAFENSVLRIKTSK